MVNPVYISVEEFKELATYRMCNDDPDQQACLVTVDSVLDQIAFICLGYDNWIQAYHDIK